MSSTKERIAALTSTTRFASDASSRFTSTEAIRRNFGHVAPESPASYDEITMDLEALDLGNNQDDASTKKKTGKAATKDKKEKKKKRKGKKAATATTTTSCESDSDISLTGGGGFNDERLTRLQAGLNMFGGDGGSVPGVQSNTISSAKRMLNNGVPEPSGNDGQGAPRKIKPLRASKS